jgi:hypothetical protein
MRVLAYLDPGAGSMVVQAVVAGLAGVAVVAKLGWRRLTSRIPPSSASERKDRPPTDPGSRNQV